MSDETQLEERTIAHAAFPYVVEEDDPLSTKGERRRFERIAHRGDMVPLLPVDIAKGERHGAFVKDDDEPKVEVDEESDTDLIAWVKGELPDQSKAPTVTDVLEASEGDVEKARRLLAAERTATGNNPRDGVVKGLEAVIARSAQNV